MKRKLYYVLAVVLLLAIVVKGYNLSVKHIKRSHYFSLDKIAATKEYSLKYPSKPALDVIGEANTILEQPFIFLGKGKQCYVFSSLDGKYVLKFLQQDKFLVNTYFKYLPNFFLAKKIQRKKARLKKHKQQDILFSLEIAEKIIKDETSLIFAHLNVTQQQHGMVSLLDSRGNLLSIPLDKVQFVLQRRAQLLKPTLVSLMHSGHEEDAKGRISQIFELFVNCNKKGVQDCDGALIRNDNLGFLDDRAIYMDIGKLRQSDKEITKANFEHDLRRLRPLSNWLEKNYPILADHFQECKFNAIQQFDD